MVLVEGWARVRTTKPSQELLRPGSVPPKGLVSLQQLPQPPLPWAGSCAAPKCLLFCLVTAHTPGPQSAGHRGHPSPGWARPTQDPAAPCQAPRQPAPSPPCRPTSQPVWARLASALGLLEPAAVAAGDPARSEQHRGGGLWCLGAAAAAEIPDFASYSRGPPTLGRLPELPTVGWPQARRPGDRLQGSR